MVMVDFDRWEALKKYFEHNTIRAYSSFHVLEIMYEIEDKYLDLKHAEREVYEKSKVIVHCSKCDARMELIPVPYNKEEIICPFQGCNQPTGMKGYYMISAGGRD
jgi:hypothetical protein